MHSFIRQLPEYRQAKSRGEQEERDRVLSLIRGRLARLPARSPRGDHKEGQRVPHEHDTSVDPVEVLDELERAVRYGWHR